VLLHVLRHVEVHERVGVAEHELRERLGEQRLADAGGAHEDERAHRPLGVLEAAAGLADRAGHRRDRLLLADDGLVQLVLELEQPLGLLLLEPRERDAGHLGDDLGDDLAVHDAADLVEPLLPLLLEVLLLLAELLGLVAELGRRLVVGVLDGLVLLDREHLDLLLDVGEVRRLVHRLEAGAPAPRPRR
jgi:hypothetical protein